MYKEKELVPNFNLYGIVDIFPNTDKILWIYSHKRGGVENVRLTFIRSARAM